MPIVPPTNLSADYTTLPKNPNIPAVKINWTIPFEPLIDKFKLYRNDVSIAEIDKTKTEFFDEAGNGEVNFATYFMTSIDTDKNESVPSDFLTNLTLKVNDFVERVRILLKDDPADPRLKRWTDSQILEALNRAKADVNATPVPTRFNLQDWPENLEGLLIQGARINLFQAQASEEAAKEFNMGIGGISMGINRSPLYLSISAQEIQMYEKQRDKVKLNFLMQVRGEGILSAGLAFRIRTMAPRQFRVRAWWIPILLPLLESLKWLVL